MCVCECVCEGVFALQKRNPQKKEVEGNAVGVVGCFGLVFVRVRPVLSHVFSAAHSSLPFDSFCFCSLSLFLLVLLKQRSKLVHFARSAQ